jgi:hypothetical protein
VRYAADIHVAVYQLLDEVLTAHVPPPGAKATIHSIVDDLRAASAPRHMIENAESISIELHRLQCAVARHDEPQASHVRLNLRSIAGAWLDHQIRN